jgi:membrane-associated protein
VTAGSDDEAATPPPPASSGRLRPWVGSAERADWVIVGLITARGVYGLAMLPLIPLMLDPHPLLLELLSGSSIAEVVVGARVRLGEVSWPVAILAGLPVWILFDWVYWWAGRRWGDRALVAMLARGGRTDAEKRARHVEAVAHRLGPAAVVLARFLPVPTFLVYAAAGTSGMRLRTFVALDVLGTTLFTATLVTLGFLLGKRAIDVVEDFNRYALLATVALVVVMVLVQLVRRRRALRAEQALR